MFFRAINLPLSGAQVMRLRAFQKGPCESLMPLTFSASHGRCDMKKPAIKHKLRKPADVPGEQSLAHQSGIACGRSKL
jgi:hypothetical protein